MSKNLFFGDDQFPESFRGRDKVFLSYPDLCNLIGEGAVILVDDILIYGDKVSREELAKSILTKLCHLIEVCYDKEDNANVNPAMEQPTP